jgi:hypothetical protein
MTFTEVKGVHSGLCFVEYSASQGCFNYNTAMQCMRDNVNMLNDGISPDYVVIGVFNSMEEACDFIRQFAPVGKIGANWPGRVEASR